MSNTDIVYGEQARQKLFDGVEKLAKAVKSTLGPRGRNTIFRTLHTGVRSTKDGVTVAKQVRSSDEGEQMGIEIVLEAAMRSNNLAGDGTTTATLLAYTLIRECRKHLETHKNTNVTKMRKGIEMASKEAIKLLDEFKVDVTEDKGMIASVATISANNDEVIGNMIAQAYDEVGIYGSIKADITTVPESYYDVTTGLQFPVGYYSPYFSTDTDTKQIIYQGGVSVMIVRDKITDYDNDVRPISAWAAKIKRPIVIIADEIDNSVLGRAVFERIKNNSLVAFVKAPYYSAKREDALQDLAALVGAVQIGSKFDTSLKDGSTLKYIGSMDTVVSTKDTTVFTGTDKDSSILLKHIEGLEHACGVVKTKFEKDRINERIAKLKGGVATIYVGGSSVVEVEEKKDRVDDAIHAIEAAIEEGVIPGGGVTLLRIMYKLKWDHIKDQDTIAGFKIFVKAILSPFTQILVNAGKVKGEIDAIFNEIISNDNIAYGYDSNAEAYCDFQDKGILDPKKVTRVAIENAVSVAVNIMTTECVIIDTSIQKQEEQLRPFMG